VTLARVKRKVREKLSFSNNYIKGTLATVIDMKLMRHKGGAESRKAEAQWFVHGIQGFFGAR
jgi:hypothetical protein